MSRHWIIEGKYLGKSTPRHRYVHELLVRPVGFHFFCTICGRLWAQAPIDNSEHHMVWSRPCKDHTWTGPNDRLMSIDIPGSIYLPWEKEFTAEMPPAVWQHELAAHMRWATLHAPPPIASACADMLPCISRQQ